MEQLQYENALENLNAEKIALDQMYVESLKSILNLKKELILANAKLAKLMDDKEKLLAKQREEGNDITE